MPGQPIGPQNCPIDKAQMKNLTIGTFALVLLFFTMACDKADVSDGTPRCVRKTVTKFSKSDDLCDNAKVDEYKFQGGKVYVFDHGTCIADGTASVMSSECKNLGNLGGFAGNTKINGEDFSTAIFVRTIWKK
jgi:hypothetical protein